MRPTLDAAAIHKTLDRLIARIEERFPGSGLASVARELSTLGHAGTREAIDLARPIWGVRFAVGAVLVAAVAGAVLLVRAADLRVETSNVFALAQSVEAMVNLLLVAGAAIFSLVTIETRLRRARALGTLHGYRAIIHVIDMHQLTKDPGMIGAAASTTAASPRRDMTPFELTRYLDYCSEMLSLTAKLAALMALSTRDGAITTAVNELEQLTANLSQKIWQKIMIISTASADQD